MKDTVVKSAIQTFLSFKLGEEIFATDVSKVLEILELRQITRIPRSPEYMKGVINLRGQVLPVIDMRIKFGLPQADTTKDTCIVVLNVEMEGDRVVLGAMVDAVSEVLEIAENEIQPSPNIGISYRAEFLNGMWKKDEAFIMLLNIDKVFSTDELLVMKESGTTEQAV